ncbi:uncharacterized protein ABDE67_018456 [Symphorus nematophorus]
MLKLKSKCFKLSIVLFLLNISNFVFPVTGFALKTCRISNNIAICAKTSPKLKAVPRDIPPTVTGFDLSANNITKIEVLDFKNLSRLTQLDLNRNYISQIEPGAFRDLISLKKLNLNNNRLGHLGEDLFNGLRNLAVLRMNNNRVNAVTTSFKSLTSLEFLDISKNRLKQLTKVHCIIQHLPNLRELYMWKNEFTTFHSWELTNSSLKLTAIDMSQNPIGDFKITADVFPNLSWFNIGGAVRKPMKYDVRNETFLSRVSTLDISGLHMLLNDMKTLLGSVNSSLTILRMNGMKCNLTALIKISCTIPTMSKLQLRRNKFHFVHSGLFNLCVNVTELDLGDNKINNIQDNAFRSMQGLRILTLSRNKLSSVPAATRNLSTLQELDLSGNTITKLGCQDFANLPKLRKLYLYLNSISALQDCVFKDLVNLQILKLQNTQLSKLNGAFKKPLPKLIQLRLNENKLTAIKCGELDGLQSLQNLSLHNNSIRTLERGSFIKLTNLTELQLQSNDLQKEAINNGSLNDLINLRLLDIRDNHIHYEDSSALLYPPFSNLSLLETLFFPGQHRRGKALLPRNFLEGLTNLKDFIGRNMQLLSLNKDTFTYTPGLQTLDLSSNDLANLHPELFSPIRSLKSIYISSINLRSLDFLKDANLTKLEFLQSRKNAYSVISEEVIKSLPALVYLDIQYNSFTCDCDNAWFLKWAKENNQTQVSGAYNFECNYPSDLKGMKLLDLDVKSCSVNIEFICFISTTCTILLFMAVSFTQHFLRLQLTYAYYFFLALLFDKKNKSKKAAHQYDAFVSYNTHDEPWVIRELLPKLEAERGWRLCLHHRDFEPGRSIIDNITDAIYGSRKTICVISHRYLDSEWCSKEIQVASFRLFDEQKDVLILVFLEDIPNSLLSPYHRMRKLLKRRTYLSWPRAKEHPEVFWQKLHQALETGEDPSEDRFHLSVVDRP